MTYYYLFAEETALNTKVKETDFRDFYPAISLDMSWKNVKPYIRQAYHTNILPFIGKTLFAALQENTIADTPDDDLTELTMLVKQALALYAINLGYPELNTHISDGMVSQPMPDKAMPVSQWAYNAARWNLILKAEKSLDIAIQFIIDNNITWDVADDYATTWICSSKELNKYVRVNGHRGYMAMHPYFKRAEQDIKTAISCEVYDDIINNYENGDYACLIEHIKSFVAHKTLWNTIPRMMAFVEGNSLLFINNAEGITGNIGVYAKANTEAVEELKTACLRDAADDLNLIISTMNADQTTFALFKTYVDSMAESKDILYSTDCHGNVVGGILLT